MIKPRFISLRRLRLKKGSSNKKSRKAMYQKLHSLGFRNHLGMFESLVDGLVSAVSAKKRRRARNIVNVPFPVHPKQQKSKALQLLINSADKKGQGHSFGERIALQCASMARGHDATTIEHYKSLVGLKQCRPFSFLRWWLCA